MSDNNIKNWEQELKDNLGNHQEPTDAKDLGSFMNKLDVNNFFEPKGNKFSGKWKLLGGLFIVGVAYWMLSSKQEIEIQTQVPVVDSETTKAEVVMKAVDSIQEIEEPNRVVITAPIVKKQESIVIEEAHPLVKEEKVEYTQEVAELEHMEEVDTVPHLIKPEEEPKAIYLPRKPIIIMSTDTTVVKDTNHVKHRKRDKKNKK
jgi:hypothetical protein